jgi:hypothetical protein
MNFTSINKTWKIFGLLGALSTSAAYGGSIITTTGVAEENPEYFTYSISITANCAADDASAERAVNGLSDKLKVAIKPFLKPQVKDEEQFILTSNNLPEQNADDIPYYDRSNSPGIACTAGHWSFTEIYLVKLLDITQRKAFQAAMLSLSKENNVSNREHKQDVTTQSIRTSDALPRLTKETKTKLYGAAYANAYEQAVDRYNAQRQNQGFEPLSFNAANQMVAQKEEVTNSSLFSPPEAGFRSMDAPDAASAGIQKLAVSVTMRFTFRD